jgi:hypothetical protein
MGAFKYFMLGALLATNMGHAAVYGIKTTSTTELLKNSGLFVVNTSTNSISSALPITLASSAVYADGLAMKKNGDLFAFINSNAAMYPTYGSAQLVSLATTGVATAIGSPISNLHIIGAAFDFNGRLWATNRLQPQLVEIDPATGVVLQTINTDRLYFDISFSADGTAYASAGNLIYKLDLTSGTGTSAYAAPSGDFLDGLAFTGNNVPYFLEGVGDDELRKAAGLTFSSPTTITTNLTGITGIANSGRMDLAGMPNAAKAVNDSYTTNTTLLIPFESSGVDISNILSNDYQLLEGSLAETVNLDSVNTNTTSANGGTVTISGGTITYKPAAGFSGVDTFTYQVCVASGSCATAVVALYVVPKTTPVDTSGTLTPNPVPGLGSEGLWILTVLILAAAAAATRQLHVRSRR